MLVLQFSESKMIPFSDSTKFNMYNLALTKREGGSTFFLYTFTDIASAIIHVLIP